MAEEDYEDGLDLDLEELDRNIEKRNQVEQRMNNLSNRAKKSAEERAEFKKLSEELKEQNELVTKERDFFASFTEETSKYPGAVEFKDAIKEKYLAGYTVEDATVSVLNKEGKLIPQEAETATETAETKPESPAGGSASNVPTTGDVPLNEMEQADKLAMLKDLEAKGELR